MDKSRSAIASELAAENNGLQIWKKTKEDDPRTIRAEFENSIGANAVHGSDSETSAVREINYFFTEEEIVSK